MFKSTFSLIEMNKMGPYWTSALVQLKLPVDGKAVGELD